MNSLLVLHGPNLNLLGQRETNLYGTLSLAELNEQLVEHADTLGYHCQCVQSNSEGICIDTVHQSFKSGVKGLIVNAGAFTHTSIALRDALLACSIPFVEIHLTQLAQREHFRHTSYLSDISVGSIMGFGPLGYKLGIDALHHHLIHQET